MASVSPGKSTAAPALTSTAPQSKALANLLGPLVVVSTLLYVLYVVQPKIAFYALASILGGGIVYNWPLLETYTR